MFQGRSLTQSEAIYMCVSCGGFHPECIASRFKPHFIPITHTKHKSYLKRCFFKTTVFLSVSSAQADSVFLCVFLCVCLAARVLPFPAPNSTKCLHDPSDKLGAKPPFPPASIFVQVLALIMRLGRGALNPVYW